MWILAAFIPLLTEVISKDKGLNHSTFDFFVSLLLLRLLGTFYTEDEMMGMYAVKCMVWFSGKTTVQMEVEETVEPKCRKSGYHSSNWMRHPMWFQTLKHHCGYSEKVEALAYVISVALPSHSWEYYIQTSTDQTCRLSISLVIHICLCGSSDSNIELHFTGFWRKQCFTHLFHSCIVICLRN